MFYDRFCALCAQRGESPSRAALNAGISKAVVSKWKQNPDAFPSGPVVKKLTDYFGVSVAELLQKDDGQDAPRPQNPDAPPPRTSRRPKIPGRRNPATPSTPALPGSAGAMA